MMPPSATREWKLATLDMGDSASGSGPGPPPLLRFGGGADWRRGAPPNVGRGGGFPSRNPKGTGAWNKALRPLLACESGRPLGGGGRAAPGGDGAGAAWAS